MDLRIAFSGDIVERQELLNGTQTITVEGTSEDGAWTMVGAISWNRGLVDYPGEGDLSLASEQGEIFATLVGADVSDADGDSDADHLIKLQYEIDGGSGEHDGVGGQATAEGRLAGETYAGVWVLTLDS